MHGRLCPVFGRGRIGLCPELALFELPAGDRLGLQAFAGIERDKPRVGAFFHSLVRDGARIHVAMGTLVDSPTMRPSAHIFVGSKASWFMFTDDLPRYEEHGVEAGG